MTTGQVQPAAPAATLPLPPGGFAPWPQFPPDEIAAVTQVLTSGKVNYWTGDEGRQFEREYAAYTGSRHALALTNGTVTLELALRVLGVGPGDEVVTPTRTFIASASCVAAVGATPIVADVDRDSQNVTAETLAAAITPRTKALIVVHLAGWPCDMDPIMALAERHGLAVIEDCAQAHGATYKGRPVGGIGHFGSFSFCQDKILTTGGEGGVLVLNDEAQWKAAWAYKDHGKSFDAVYHREHAPGFRWLHESWGTNWRLTEMQSALGRVQLRKLDGWVASRRAHAETLAARLGALPGLRVPLPPADVQHAYYKFYAFVRPEALAPGWDRDRIMQAVAALGVPCASGSCSEIYLEKAFPEALRPAERFPVAQELGETSLMFQVHPTLTADAIEATCQAVERVLAEATA